MSKPNAYCLIRPLLHYRCEAFISGLEAVGYNVVCQGPGDPKPGDILVIWNRYGTNELWAEKYERKGCKVVICENGYLGQDNQGRQYYAIALHEHKGAGTWHIGGQDRWLELGLEVKPWQPDRPGTKIVIRGQRGIGSKRHASPPNWHNDIAVKIRRQTKRPVEVIDHPGTGSKEIDLTGVHCVVTWASSIAGHALLQGVPVFYAASRFIYSQSMYAIRSRGSGKTDQARQVASV